MQLWHIAVKLHKTGLDFFIIDFFLNLRLPSYSKARFNLKVANLSIYIIYR